MADLFMEEIKEDMRQEQMLRLWGRYKTWIVGGVAAILVGTGTFLVWDQWNQKKQMQWVSDFSRALELERTGKVEESEAMYKAISQKSKNFGMLAEWRLAALALKKFQTTSQLEAKQQYLHDAISALSREENQKLDPVYRDFSALLSVYLIMDTRAQEALDKLEKLVGKDNVWRILALEAKAVILNRLGRQTESEGLLRELSQENTPPAVQQRVRALLSTFQTGQGEGALTVQQPDAKFSKASQ